MIKTYNKVILASAISLSLMACGGGGSSSSSENNTPEPTAQPSPITYSLSLASAENQNVAADEQSTITLDLNESTNSTKSITYTFATEPERSYISATVAEQQLTITIDELENDEQTTLTVTGEVEGKQATVELVLTLTNRSAEVVISEATIWQEQSNVFKYDDLENVAPKYIQAAYFAGAISLNDKQSLAEEFQATIQTARDIVNSIDVNQSLSSKLTQYQSSTITESELAQALAQQKTVAQAQSGNILSALNLIAALNADAPSLPTSTYQYIPEYDVFSAIIGNDELGEFSDGKWSFTGNYQFLNQLVGALGTPSTCDAE